MSRLSTIFNNNPATGCNSTTGASATDGIASDVKATVDVSKATVPGVSIPDVSIAGVTDPGVSIPVVTDSKNTIDLGFGPISIDKLKPKLTEIVKDIISEEQKLCTTVHNLKKTNPSDLLNDIPLASRLTKLIPDSIKNKIKDALNKYGCADKTAPKATTTGFVDQATTTPPTGVCFPATTLAVPKTPAVHTPSA